ncbi:hypothetical protein ABBQ32_002813 [Trebouxia sp. C0010 RCD-2024]
MFDSSKKNEALLEGLFEAEARPLASLLEELVLAAEQVTIRTGRLLVAKQVLPRAAQCRFTIARKCKKLCTVKQLPSTN